MELINKETINIKDKARRGNKKECEQKKEWRKKMKKMNKIGVSGLPCKGQQERIHPRLHMFLLAQNFFATYTYVTMIADTLD